MAIASVVVLLMLVSVVYWAQQGGHRRELIDIDHAEPIEIQFQVDANSADWPELAQLPRIGETLARRIVESRQEQGPFSGHDDLQRVRGIGPRTLEQIRPYLAPLTDIDGVAQR